MTSSSESRPQRHTSEFVVGVVVGVAVDSEHGSFVTVMGSPVNGYTFPHGQTTQLAVLPDAHHDHHHPVYLFVSPLDDEQDSKLKARIENSENNGLPWIAKVAHSRTPASFIHGDFLNLNTASFLGGQALVDFHGRRWYHWIPRLLCPGIWRPMCVRYKPRAMTMC